MAINTSTLRPGLLISLKSSLRGNVQYSRRDLETGKKLKKGTESYAKWETERTIEDAAEWEAGQKARTKARVTVTRICSLSAFGLMCPQDKEDQLEEAIKEAKQIVDEFNQSASLTRIGIYVLTGRIAADDVEAMRAINSEVRDLLSDMEDGLKRLDVKAVREAAQKARGLGSMLTADSQARIQIAIDAARASAKEIVRAGEQHAMEIDNLTIKRIAEQRTAFLDLDEAKEVAKPKAASRAVDLKPVKGKVGKAQNARARSLDL